MNDPIAVFDRGLVRKHRDRAAALLTNHDFLLQEVAERVADRLSDFARRFPTSLDLGCHNGNLAAALNGRGGIETLIQCDLSLEMAKRAADNGRPSLAADEEYLPFAPNSFDAIISIFSLHWVNDLPGAFIQIRQALKPDGLFLAAMLGGNTLHELRAALMQAEIAEENGASPRISPFAELRDAGGLLQRSGFALPVADIDSITVTYPHAFALMQDLRGMGETNAVLNGRRTAARRATLYRAADEYRESFGDRDGRLPATFDVIYMTGWSKHSSQQQALRPGSAKSRLSDALGTPEHHSSDKTQPK